MELTNPQRIARLASHLVRHPENVGRYLRHNVIRRPAPVDLALPWFSYAAIDFLEKHLRPEMHVFEFGSGGSTLFFAARCASVTSVEEDSGWREIVVQSVKRRGLRNVTLRMVLFDFAHLDGFESSEYLGAVRQGSPDVIVIDGTDWNYDIRPICFRVAEQEISTGGIIIVDDSWRYPQLRQQNRAQRFEIFESVGPARFGVTSTDIYFY